MSEIHVAYFWVRSPAALLLQDWAGLSIATGPPEADGSHEATARPIAPSPAEIGALYFLSVNGVDAVATRRAQDGGVEKARRRKHVAPFSLPAFGVPCPVCETLPRGEG
jgi:hypothetical protein